MLQAAKSIAKTLLFGVRRDRVTGHLYYPIGDVRVYIRAASECEREKHRRYAFEQVYFKHYRPTNGDCVVDFGAGTGTEAVALAAVAPAVRYVAVEIQPWVYECLSLTLGQLPSSYQTFGLAVGDGQPVAITPTIAGIDASAVRGGQVPVQGIRWAEFATQFSLERVDLLKMNIEGGETALLRSVDLAVVRRVIVSCHDFRADRGHGEHFRTRADVESLLVGAGFTITRLDGPADWICSWVFAERKE